MISPPRQLSLDCKFPTAEVAGHDIIHTLLQYYKPPSLLCLLKLFHRKCLKALLNLLTTVHDSTASDIRQVSMA
jgi:hypothetical protein